MNENRRPAVPLKLLALDTIGAVLIGLGFAKQFAGIDLLPEAMRFEHDGIAMIAVGVALTLPMMLHLFAAARARREAP